MSNRIARFKTNLGDFAIELFEDRAPRTTKNFIDLVEKKFYVGNTFHRVIAGFMIQTGDPTGTGKGGPGYEIRDEFHFSLNHRGEGVVSMANAGPDTGGSQFFITLDTAQHLDGKHSIFGRVVEGIEVVRAIGKVKTNVYDRPLKAVTIESITIESGKTG